VILRDGSVVCRDQNGIKIERLCGDSHAVMAKVLGAGWRGPIPIDTETDPEKS
jgi:hypothetical protein